MRSSTTRLLLLGAVALFEPVNGYQIRRELMSWQVDQWGNVKPGSIYHGLSQLVSSGLAIRHDLTDGARTVAVYQLTEAGRAEFDRLLVEAVVSVNAFDRHDFHAAIGLLPILDADRGLELLERRQANLKDELADFPSDPDPADFPYAPPMALRGLQLWGMELRAESAWLSKLIDDIHAGGLTLGYDDWAPPADDPGHQMSSDRARYRSMIGDQAT